MLHPTQSSLSHSHQPLPIAFAFVAALLTLGAVSFCFAGPQGEPATKWVGTWSTAPQLVEPNNNPPAPGLSNNTLRQIVHVSIGGDSLRLRFSNEFSSDPVTMHEVHIAASTGGGTIDTATDRAIYFNGMSEVTMAAGSAINSDLFEFALAPLSDVVITIYFGNTSATVTGHPGSRTTSYILTGNEVAEADVSGAAQTEHWYVINTIDVRASDSSYVVAVLGNSITDGRGSGTNMQNRWPDELARRLQSNPATQRVAVLNEGIGGNCVLGACLGPSALDRFRRDVLDQNGVKWLIILEGINDIGNGGAGVGSSLINAFTQMTDSAHARGILVYGATLLPMKGSFYYSETHETERRTVNEWIRTSSLLDGVIDLDKAVRNPSDTLSLLPDYDTGDHLHPNEAGHHAMAEAVDLSLFSSAPSTSTGSLEFMETPDGYALGQNFPNPFNPTTTIRYVLPKESKVSIRIYSLLGQVDQKFEVGNQKPGSYAESWTPTSAASGIYFCHLEAVSLTNPDEQFVEMKRMILLK